MGEDERGQASVELIAVLPALGLGLLIVAQFALAGWSLWSAGIAARAGARAVTVGDDAERLARRALPPRLRRGASVKADRQVAVRVTVPRVVPGLPRFAVAAAARLWPASGRG